MAIDQVETIMSDDITTFKTVSKKLGGSKKSNSVILRRSFIAKKPFFEKKNLVKAIEERVDVVTHNFLQDVIKKDYLRFFFENFLFKNSSTSVWMFWIDLNNLIENKMDPFTYNTTLQKMCRKHLAKFSQDEVNSILFLFHFIFITLNFIFLFIYLLLFFCLFIFIYFYSFLFFLIIFILFLSNYFLGCY